MNEGKAIRKEIAEAIITLVNFKNDPSVQALLVLLNHYTNEAREANDTEPDEWRFRMRQGEIKAYLRVKDNIMRGLGPWTVYKTP